MLTNPSAKHELGHRKDRKIPLKKASSIVLFAFLVTMASAENCRTSVEMIEKYYAAHIKTSLDAAAINVMRTRKNKKGKKAIQNTQASPQPPEQEMDV